ncbi:hypothetical protein [Nocardioides flavescens]|uniref:Uncharacterized protein n=1 Tax=Nocardioides flavescens TaxID=2691959 RepID=A0A6L7EXP5_9ACTN|nr:hypothetical protein [Nocardioides flavescens]MXG88869.1 hypothetical protein [Nocardioides flavescens]
MTARERPRRSGAGRSGAAWSGAAVLAGVAAFVWLPAAVAGLVPGAPDGAAGAQAALGPALSAYLEGTDPRFPPDLQTLVDYWRVWHAVKIVVTAGLVLVLVASARATWAGWVRVGGAARRLVATVATGLVPVAGLLLVVNVQATAAPSIALLPLSDASPGHEIEAGRPPVAALLDDVEVYHLSLVVAAAVAALASAGAVRLAVRARRGRARGARERTALGAVVVVAASAASAFVAVAALSAIALADPVQALQDALG